MKNIFRNPLALSGSIIITIIFFILQSLLELNKKINSKEDTKYSIYLNMFEKLEDLAKNNKKISDFHIRAGSPLAYRQTGEIIKVNDVMVTPQDLQDLLALNCNEK